MNSLLIPVLTGDEIVGLEHVQGQRLDEARYVEVRRKSSDNKLIYRFDKAKPDDMFGTLHSRIPDHLALLTDYESVEINFKTNSEELIETAIVDLKKYANTKRASKKREEQYEKMREIVHYEMEHPKGTEEEKSEHTMLLRDANSSDKAKAYLKSRITNILLRNFTIKPAELENLVYRLYGELYGLGVIQELDDDPEMGEIMVNAIEFPEFKCSVYYIKNGEKFEHDKTFKSLSDLKKAFNNVIRFSGEELNRFENPRVEATRPNRDRVNIIIPDASENWRMNIRKFTNFIPSRENMKASGTIDSFIDNFMDLMVRGRANIGIGGEMGTGKTTFINYLLTYTPPIEGKVVIASVSETDTDRVLAGHDISVFNVNDKRGLTFDELLRTALRTTAARVIIPESRGGEFKTLYEANVKTKGNMFTAHALDAESFMDMSVDMYLSSDNVNASESSDLIKNKITKAMDVVLIMRKVGKTIRIKSISEVLQDENGNYGGMSDIYVFEYDPDNPDIGAYVRTENRLSERLRNFLNEHGLKRSELEEY